MHPDTLSRRTVTFVNIAHALDHFVLLIYPTAVIAIAAERGLDYGALIGLATGAFVAFGLFSLPMGWLSERFGRRNLLAAFFGGCGLACLGISTATTETGFAVWLFVLGVFSAIYHPIGGAMLVTHARRLGRDLRLERGLGEFGCRVGIRRDRHRRGDAGLAGGFRGSWLGLPCGGGGFPRPGSGRWRRVAPSGREPPGSFPFRVR